MVRSINDIKYKIKITVGFIFAILTSFGFTSNPSNSIALPCIDTVSFSGNYPSTNIYLLDSYSTKNSIKLYWSTGFGFDPPYLYFKEVRVYFSLTSIDSGFCELLRNEKIGSDSTFIEGLNEGDTYYFRVATYDSTDQIVSLSRPIMTILGDHEQFTLSILAPQRESSLYYSGLAWSTNSKNLAFLKTSNNSVNIVNFDLTTMSESQVTNYTGTDYRLLGLDWSPDNNWISYCYTPSSTFAEVDYRIWLVSPTGGIPHSITSGRVDASATWLSATRMLFTKGTIEPPNIPEFYVVDFSDNNSERQLTSDQIILKYNPSINLSHNLVAFNSSSGIYTMTLLGYNIDPIILSKYWSDIHPFWSADGQNIIFTSSRSGHYEIWSINVESKKIQQITRSQKRGVGRFYGRPSPDGKQLALLEVGDIFEDATIRIISNITVYVDNIFKPLPLSFLLYQNYPNPFNPTTTIMYTLLHNSQVKLIVLDILGRQVRTLVDEEKSAGNYKIEFNASDLSSGVYFYNLQTSEFSQTKKLVLMR